MADEPEKSGWGENMDRAAHETTYRKFLDRTKWISIAVVGILLFLLIFIYG